jgi:histidyl-tRNA synthetase
MKIEPRVLKGFKDSLPSEELLRKNLIQKLEQVFESFGFLPIDTPVIEYSDILLGKGGGETDKQVYRFNDSGNRDVTLRYDLTVPFARFMAKHYHELGLPFRRYHIAKVWRGENTQRGRYREFFQCDFDLVGTDNPSSDLEILILIAKSLEALGLSKFRIHVSHRGMFNTFLKKVGIEEHSAEIFRTVDKLKKTGRQKVSELLNELIDKKDTDKVLSFISFQNTVPETLSKLEDLLGSQDENIQRLIQIFDFIKETGLSNIFYLDTSITRGLDYYTGIVFETFLLTLPEIGSICSGGRYNNLASLYTDKGIPGVGASIGLDRLMAALDELGHKEENIPTVMLIILCLDENLTGYYHQLALRFREYKIRTEVYPVKKKLAKQFAYAEKKNIPFALICGEEEKQKDLLTLKNLSLRKNYQWISLKEVVQLIINR